MFYAKVESATKKSFTIMESDDIVQVQKQGKKYLDFIKIYRENGYNKNIACVRIYEDNKLLEQYGSI